MRIIIIIFIILIILAPFANWPEYRVEGGMAGVAPPIVKAAMKYHGIKGGVTIDSFGYGFFYRNGKKCKLFNKTFLKMFKKHNQKGGKNEKKLSQ